MMTSSAAVSCATQRWRARLSLQFRSEGAVTRLARRSAHGPLQVQRPFPQLDGSCHVYLLHPPGGIVGGDHLDIEVEAESGARALLTTPAAAKWYRSAGPLAEAVHAIRVGRRATLDWLPLETIVYSGARARSVTRIDLDEDARVAAWEILCLGRPASSEQFSNGRFEQDMELYRQGRPLLLEKNRYDGGGVVLNAPWGLGGRTVTGLLIAAPCEALLVDGIVAQFPADAAIAVAASCVDDVLVVRALGDSAESVRHALTRIWRALRGVSAAALPRIWNT